MDSKVYFSTSGSGSVSGRVTIPKAFLEILEIDKNNREIEIKLEGDKITIKKRK